jgi:probable HAF family extracellular repeat protein
VGSTQDSQGSWSHAFIWEDNVMTDLNTLFPTSSNLFTVMANKINQRTRTSLGHGNRTQQARCGQYPRLSGNPCTPKHGQVGCRGRAYTPEIQFTRELLATGIRRDSDSPTSSDKSYFRSIRTMHSGHMLLERLRHSLKVTQGILGNRNPHACEEAFV